MKIRDITKDEIRAGKNWRVLDSDALLEVGVRMEDLDIEPLKNYCRNDTLVYSGIYIYLRNIGEPRTGFWDRVKGKGRRRLDCCFPPDNPKELESGQIPIVSPLLMIKEVQESGWDYCEYVNGMWQQLGLKANPDAPLGIEFFANPVEEDSEFNICVDSMLIRESHRNGFLAWISYMED